MPTARPETFSGLARVDNCGCGGQCGPSDDHHETLHLGAVSLQTASIPVSAETAETPTLPWRGGTDRGQESVIKPCWQGGCMGDRRVTD